MGKKKKLGAPREAYNPYFGKFEDESQMAKKPFFTWLLVVPGTVAGLLVAAKHPYGQEKLKHQLHTGAFRRVYLAVCDGLPRPPEGVIDAPIGRVPGSLMARRVDPEGQSARTHYRVIRAAGERALVELELDTGRTHQIRVHLAHMGCPLTGDFLYGREAPDAIGRPALHSAWLSLTHPVTGERLDFSCPLPMDMERLL